MDVRKIFDEMSLIEEFNFDKDVIDIEALKQTGKVFYLRRIFDNRIHESIDYVSNDGSLAFSKEFSYEITDEKKVRLQQIEDLMKTAIGTENYELAKKLKDEKDSL